MSDEIEWGPWIVHDGKGCPLQVGTIVMAEILGLGVLVGDIEETANYPPPGWFSRWIYNAPDTGRVVRYRIRKPRSTAMDRLAEMARDPKAPITAPEGPVRTPEHIATAKRAEVEQH